ncbi:MAG: VWA domain-containing protein [Chloroflexota bacterium]
MKTFKITGILTIALLLVLTACGGASISSTGGRPANAVEVSIIYAPESDLYLPQIIAEFNRLSGEGTNPVTGQPWGGTQPVWIVGETGSSGVVAQGIVNAFIAPNNENVSMPVIFQPSVSHWLALVNFNAGREVFDLSDAQATALAPVVMAIWESRLNAIQETVGYEEIGWEELVAVLDSPNGWQDFGIEDGRRTVFYGHTDPFVSSTALSTLIAEFYAGARQAGYTERRLTQEMVSDEDVQENVRRIEEMIRHYSRRTTEFKEYIAQGPDYLDFVALEENDLIFINEGKTEFQPPERLVALYPKEGTFWHEHPFGIVNANWVTPEQQAGARIFTDYVLLPENQQQIMTQGFRPANPDVELAYPFVPENGVTVEGPSTVLSVPEPQVIAAIQESWAFVKKSADIILLMDISGSMEDEGKLIQAKEAANLFINSMEPNNRIGLAVFNDTVQVRVPLDTIETNATQVAAQIDMLSAGGGTALYDAIQQSTQLFGAENEENRIRAIVLLSDGSNTAEDGVTLNDATQAIRASRDDINPVIVIPVAYGQGADIQALNSIARASATRVQSGSTDDISGILELISSYF